MKMAKDEKTKRLRSYQTNRPRDEGANGLPDEVTEIPAY